MSSWISHLRIAENLLLAWPDLDEKAFTFGNLAPDSGIPTGDGLTYDPPKEVTHFLRAGGGSGRVQDLVFYRDYLAPLQSDDPSYSFALGYFCHLVSDNLWSLRVVQAIRRDYLARFGGHNHLMWQAVNPEFAAIDWRYVQAHQHGLFQRVFLVSPNPPAPFPFLNEEGLRAQFDSIRRHYHDYEPPPLEPCFQYINETTVARYVADATASLIKIERALRRDEVGDTPTALALLSPEEQAPYDAPLGDVQP